jgi:hypothetical protein
MLHKMKINSELCCKRYEKDPKLSLSELLSGWQYSNLFIWPSMRTRLEHAHCLETIKNMWFLGKRETVNAWKKADFDGFIGIIINSYNMKNDWEKKATCSAYLSTIIKHFLEFAPSNGNGPTDPLHQF